MADRPDLSDVLRQAIASRLAAVHTTLPGRVVSFASGPPATVTVELGVDFHKLDEDGRRERYTPPQLPNLPIVYPGAGGYAITWPLAAGDEVLVLFAERSLVEWLANGGAGNEPKIARRHSIADAVVLPGLRSRPNDVPAASHDAAALVVSVPGGSSIKLGATATKAVNRTGDDVLAGSALAATLAAVNTALTTIAAAVPVVIVTPPVIATGAVIGETGAGSSVVKADD